MLCLCTKIISDFENHILNRYWSEQSCIIWPLSETTFLCFDGTTQMHHHILCYSVSSSFFGHLSPRSTIHKIGDQTCSDQGKSSCSTYLIPISHPETTQQCVWVSCFVISGKHDLWVLFAAVPVLSWSDQSRSVFFSPFLENLLRVQDTNPCFSL